MVRCTLWVVVAVVALTGVRGQNDVNCDIPPRPDDYARCCQMPRDNIWGDTRAAMRGCHRELRKNMRSNARLEETDQGEAGRGGEDPQCRRKLSDRLRDFVHRLSETIKGVVEDVMLIFTDRFMGHRDDGCMMECVFGKQGWVKDGVLDKKLVVASFEKTLQSDEEWLKVAKEAVDSCPGDSQERSENKTCKSGADELYNCVTIHLITNCPNSPANDERCDEVKRYHTECKNAYPPPPPHGRHPPGPPPPRRGGQGHDHWGGGRPGRPPGRPTPPREGQDPGQWGGSRPGRPTGTQTPPREGQDPDQWGGSRPGRPTGTQTPPTGARDPEEREDSEEWGAAADDRF